LLLLFLAVYSIVIISPIKSISKFSFLKAAMTIIVFWILQITIFAIQITISKIIFKPFVNYIK